MINFRRTLFFTLSVLFAMAQFAIYGQDKSDDLDQQKKSYEAVAEIFRTRCLSCHNSEHTDGELSLQTLAAIKKGGWSGPAVVPGSVFDSYLVDMITSEDGKPAMPQDADPLTDQQVNTIKKWIADGAYWPENETLSLAPPIDLDWWSLKPLQRPSVPELAGESNKWVSNPIDAFIAKKHEEMGFAATYPASKLQLIRRLYFDLVGLPPSPDEIESFINDDDPKAYENLVEKLLASPQYGERWARHWLDLVQYADTHGYDKDKMRNNAWPYRDYVIESFNQDKPYSRFVREQIAGDVLFPETAHGQVATGFLSAGPWDFIGHVEVPESKIDGQIARLLDRDDMVSTTMNTFVSTTVQCARCHHHKFDPVHQEHYYALHAVFADLDRADNAYDADPAVAKKRFELEENLAKIKAKLEEAIGPKRFKQLETAMNQKSGNHVPEFGWHSDIAMTPDTPSWIQFGFHDPQRIKAMVLYPAFDDFNNIGAGFGFPVRFKVEVSNDPDFTNDIKIVFDQTNDDLKNPGLKPFRINFPSAPEFKFIRITVTKRSSRKDDYNVAFAEVKFIHKEEVAEAPVAPDLITSSGSIEAPPRWQEKNLFDQHFPRSRSGNERQAIMCLLTPEAIEKLESRGIEFSDENLKQIAAHFEDGLYKTLKQTIKSLEALPKQQQVYSATVHNGNGNFRGRAGLGPREIRVLKRGNVRTPGEIAQPGTIPVIAGRVWEFGNTKTLGERRVSLADWTTRKDNPLTWRSIVNRVWHYHFGKGIVNTPNDFGRMGAQPTHPELLDWLAVEFRDGGDWIKNRQSIKDLHRLIVNSSVYKQASADNAEYSAKDKNNQYLWRMNRRQLDAESIRDSMLVVSGKLDKKMYGAPFKNFVVEKPEHSPHYRYGKYDPNNPESHRRSIYRFVVRSQQQPLMNSLNCADPNQRVAVRNQSNTVTQSLAMLNNKFVLAMSNHLAQRLKNEHDELSKQITLGFTLVTGRGPIQSEFVALHAYALENGLEDACRVLFNLNEFAFVD